MPGSLVAICGGLGKALGAGPVAEAVKFVFRALTLFNIDYGATYPGCGGSSASAVDVFWLSLELMFAYVRPAIGACLAAAAVGYGCDWILVRTSRYHRRYIAVPVLGPLFEFRSWKWYARRAAFSLLLWTNLMWLTLVRLAIGAVACTKIDGELYMVTALSQRCFADGHTTMFVAGTSVLLWCLVGFPGVVLRLLRRFVPDKRHRHNEQIQLFGMMYAPIKDAFITRMLCLHLSVRLLIATTQVHN